ncbi:MAG: hypothetical protein ACOY4Q_05330 [Bacillota bacterium]
MDILRKILYALIGVLIIIVAAGGGYLALTGGHGANHGKDQQTAQKQQPQTPGANGQQNQTPATTGQQPQNPGTPGQQSQNTGAQGQQPQTNGQQPVQAPPGLYPAAPPVRTIDPDPYYDRLNKAREAIEDANKMITVDPFANTGNPDTANSGADMSKFHQGIYKMSQGMSIMEDTLDTLNKDIRGDARFAPNPNQPAYPGYYPYQGYYQPNASYGYNPQYPYNQVPGSPYQQPQPGQSQPNNQTDTGQPNNQQLQQTPGNQPMNHGADTANPLGNVSLKKLFTYIAYGILAASIIGVFVAILGMVNSMFKKPDSSQS